MILRIKQILNTEHLLSLGIPSSVRVQLRCFINFVIPFGIDAVLPSSAARSRA